jgi:hypothetical protein
MANVHVIPGIIQLIIGVGQNIFHKDFQRGYGGSTSLIIVHQATSFFKKIFHAILYILADAIRKIPKKIPQYF